MDTTVFAELKFWLPVLFSLVAPVGIYGLLMRKRAISRTAVLLFGLALVAIAGIDVFLLRSLVVLVRDGAADSASPVFGSEVSLALYIFPILYGGIGVNLISHILISHLLAAERKFDREHAGREAPKQDDR